MLRKEQKTEIINANRTHENDTGSPEVQVAILTERIAILTAICSRILRTTTPAAACSRWSASAAVCWTTCRRRTLSAIVP